MLSILLQIPTPSEEEIEARTDTAMAHISRFADTLAEDPAAAMSQLGLEMLDFALKVLVALIIYVVGAWLIKRIRKWLERFFQRKNTDKTAASFISSFVSATLSVLLVIIAISTLGVNTSSLAVLLAAGGMAIGMALSGTVQNFSGGVLILISKPFKVGDAISAQGYSGTVTNISILSTSLLTADNRTVLIPNGALFNGTIDNITRQELRRVEWTIGMEYGTDADECINAFYEIMKRDPRILDSSTPGAQAPFASILALSASSVDFTVRAWVKTDDYWPVFFDIQKNFYTELPGKGFSFPFPQLDVRMKS